MRTDQEMCERGDLPKCCVGSQHVQDTCAGRLPPPQQTKEGAAAAAGKQRVLVASGLVSSDAEAKAVAKTRLVYKLSPAVLDERIEALRLCGWNHAGLKLLPYDTARLIERSVFLDSLGCVLGALHLRMCLPQRDATVTFPPCQSLL